VARARASPIGVTGANSLISMETGVLTGLAAFRWAAWLWIAAVTLIGRHQLRHPVLAWVLIGIALVITASLTVLLRRDPAALLRPAPVATELACGFALLLCDGWAYGPGHAFATSQSLGVAWPVAGVLTAGVAWGAAAGGIAGVAMGFARLGATLANGVSMSSITGSRVTSLVSTAVLYASAGAVAGYVAMLLRRAERQISAARAREEIVRTLHDGVLQTLAVVERRADDPALARLAREQERELREYLFGVGAGATLPQPAADLGSALRAAAARFEDAFDGRVQVIVADDVPPIAGAAVEALAGAVGEALTNAGKHGSARRVTVYVEPDGAGVFCSVKDDGTGFDVETTREGIGVSRSIRGRVVEVGGRVELRSRPGDGAEVCMWLP
jgi:signal transduction histidine kinase